MFRESTQIITKSIFPLFHYGSSGCSVLGTGFFIDDEGHFLTAAHVINALPKAHTLGYLGNIPDCNFKGKSFISVKIISKDVDKDLALGQIIQEKLPPLTLSPDKALVGESISLCGYPMPMIQILNKSLNKQTKNIGLSFDVSAVRKYWQPTIKLDEIKPNFILNKKFRSLLTQHAALPGMSGGPIFNKDAKVIGITSAVWPRKVPISTGQFIDIPNGIGIELEEIKQFLKSVIKSDTV